LVFRSGSWSYIDSQDLEQKFDPIRPRGIQEGDRSSLATEPASPFVQAPTVIPSSSGVIETQPNETTKSDGSFSSKPKIIAGVKLPMRPTPPKSDDCCMSGCARCVYDLYAENLTEYYADLLSAKQTLAKVSNLKPGNWFIEELSPKTDLGSMTNIEDLAEDLSNKVADQEISALDISMRVFLATERKIRRRKKERETLGDAAGQGYNGVNQHRTTSTSPSL